MKVQTTVRDVERALENVAPSRLAENWDNVGLMVGDRTALVTKILLALDPMAEVLAEAADSGCDCVVTHHPLFFTPLARMDLSEPVAREAAFCVAHGLTLLCAHTNLDKAPGGVNAQLANRLGLTEVTGLGPAQPVELCRVAAIAPPGRDKAVEKVLASFSSRRVESLSHRLEIRVEAVVARRDLTAVSAALKNAAPDSGGFLEAWPLLNHENAFHLGLVGRIPEPMTLSDLARWAGRRLSAPGVKSAGDPDLWVKRVAVCAGSGGGMVKSFYASGAQAFITGDVRYHDARDVAARGLGIVDVGHYASERLALHGLAEALAKEFARQDRAVDLIVSEREHDPFALAGA
ncbi:MAG: Nif3-like dinuclear metal center hexameric protein [Proteobacteria bacterium]|nr:Nif3-like dinuclear metal center hexameric protein [Pseudomonadota bacterium]